MHLINHSLKKVTAIAAASALLFSLFVSGGMVMAAPPSVPVITSPADATSTTTSPVRIYGTGEVGSEVFVSGGATPASGVVDASGYWTALVNLNLDSTNVLSFLARNSASEDSASVSLTITHVSSTSTPDTTAPDAPVVSFPTFPTSTTTSPITLGGTAEANASIGISGGLTTVNTTADASGAWNASVGLNASSTNMLVIVATDASGNVSTPTTVSITHLPVATSTSDVTPPLAPVVSFPTSPYSTSTSPVFIFGTAEAGSEVFVSGGATPASGITNASGNWSALVNLTPDATNTLSLVARDIAGNDSSSTPLVITHFSGTTTPDTTAPDAPVITFPTSPYTTSSNAVVVTGTAEAGSIISIDDGTGPATTTASTGGVWSVTVVLPMGTTTTYMFTATDAAGNTSSSTSLVITQSTSGGTGSTTSATSSPTITLIGDQTTSLFTCNASDAGFVDPGFTAVDSAGNPVTATSTTGSVNVTTPGTYTVVYTATSGTSTATTTRTVVVLNCSSGGGGGGTSSAGDSNQNTSNSSSGGTTTSGTPGTTEVLGVTYVPYTLGTTQVLGATYTPGLPTTGAGGDVSRNLLALMLSGGLVILGIFLKRKQA